VAGTRFALLLLLPSKTEVTKEVVVAPARDDFPSEPSLVETQPAIFDPGEMYYLQTDNVPKAFADIKYLDLVTRKSWEEDGKYFDRPIIPTGYLFAEKEFKLGAITIAHREFTFYTAEIKGVSYKFVGYFPKYPEFVEYCDGCEYPPDLKGRLTKLTDGKVIAETEIEFYVEHCAM